MTATATRTRPLSRGEQAVIIAAIVLLVLAAVGLLGAIVQFIVAYIGLIISLFLAAITLMILLFAVGTALWLLSVPLWLSFWGFSALIRYNRRETYNDYRRAAPDEEVIVDV